VLNERLQSLALDLRTVTSHLTLAAIVVLSGCRLNLCQSLCLMLRLDLTDIFVQLTARHYKLCLLGYSLGILTSFVDCLLLLVLLLLPLVVYMFVLIWR